MDYVSVRYNVEAEVRRAEKRPAEVLGLKWQRRSQFPLAGVATPAERSRNRFIDLHQWRQQPSVSSRGRVMTPQSLSSHTR